MHFTAAPIDITMSEIGRHQVTLYAIHVSIDGRYSLEDFVTDLEMGVL